MRAVIVGAGVAGPALASFLSRCGIGSVICEARPRAAREEGAFLGIAPNGMRVLAELGLDGEVRSRGHACAGFSFLNGCGEQVGAIDHGDVEARYGAPLVMIRRGVLHEVLVAGAERRGVALRWGARLAEIDMRSPGEVVARFEDGGAERGDLLVGCDGLRSRTRALLFPGAPPPPFTGLLDFGGYAPASCEVPLEVGWNVMVFGERAFFGAFRTASEGTWWFHNGASPEPVRELSPDARRARILAEHAADPLWIRALVEATPEVLGPWPVHEVAALERWHVGRVGVIGDAAHATSPSAGQGASLALEDAMVLARCLRDTGDPDRAFAMLVRERAARVADVVEQSRRNSSRKTPSSPLGRWLRDRALPLFLRMGASAQHRAYAYRVTWDGDAT